MDFSKIKSRTFSSNDLMTVMRSHTHVTPWCTHSSGTDDTGHSAFGCQGTERNRARSLQKNGYTFMPCDTMVHTRKQHGRHRPFRIWLAPKGMRK